MANEAEDLEGLIVPIMADMEPLFRSIEAGLKTLRDKLQSSGALKLTADVDVMLKSLTGVQPKVDQWAKETSAKAQVTPTVNTAPLSTGLQRAQAEITHTIGSNIGLTGWTDQIAMLAQRLEGGLAPALARVSAALKGLNFSGFIAQLRSGMSAINEFVNGLGLITKGFLVVGAAYAGWKIGTAINDFKNKTADTWVGWITGARQYEMQMQRELIAARNVSDAELEVGRAHIEAKYGVDMAIDTYRVFLSLMPQQRKELLDNAQAAGTLKMDIDSLSQAVRDLNDAARQNAIKDMLAGEAKSFKEYVAYYSMSKMGQLSKDAMDVRNELIQTERILQSSNMDEKQRETLIKKRIDLLKEEDRIQSRRAQEYRRIQEAENKPGRERKDNSAEEAARAAERQAEANYRGAQQTVETWREAHRAMTLDTMNETEKAKALIEEKTNKYIEAARIATMNSQELAVKMVEIEKWKADQIQALEEESLEKAKQALDRKRQEQESAFQQQRSALQQYVQGVMNPLQAWVDSVYDTLNRRAAVFAEGFQSMMQPLSNAFAGLITGMKVSWSGVLSQMIAQFAQIFVNKFLAWVGEMIVRWVFGETAKTTASATGAAARTAIAAAEVGANQMMTVAALDLAIAEIFAAHASIPFAGVGIATAFVAQMMATYTAFAAMAQGMAAASGGALTGFAEGGRIDRPTWGLLGELWEPEVIAPEKDFKAVIAELIGNGPNRPEPAGGEVHFHSHYHGAGIIDTGNKALLRSSCRKINAENKVLSKKTLG